MKTQSKKTRRAEGDHQAPITVYHIAIPHQEEIWREWVSEIKKFLPKVEILVIEFTTLLENSERERIENHFNELSQGKVSPRLHPVDVLKPALSWATLEEFIYNTRKKIYLEKTPVLASELYERHDEALRENVALFFQRRYVESGMKYREAMELQLNEIELRDAEIARELDEIGARERGNILLLLGEDHSPSPVQAKIIRWEPMRYTNLAREIGDAVRVLRAEELDELLFRRIGMFWVEGYWEAAGEAGIKAIERAIRILDSIPRAHLKKLYDFITEGKQADAFFRAILWLKREGFITEDEI